jgi:collagenase-like PrtC family protease
VQIRVLCRTPNQIDAVLGLPWLDEVALDFLEVHGLRDAVKKVQSTGKRVVVATPRVLKPNEQRLWRFYLGLGADALLLRSAGLLQQFLNFGGPGAIIQGTTLRVPELMGDFSLNVANAVAARWFLSSLLTRVTPTHDLNTTQLLRLAGALDPAERAQLEVIVHQHLPIFHTEHCVFCRFLSDGNSYKDCGHPCESAQVHLRDEHGHDHLVLADMGCRNTVFNAQAQTGVLQLRQLLQAGYRCDSLVPSR